MFNFFLLGCLIVSNEGSISSINTFQKLSRSKRQIDNQRCFLPDHPTNGEIKILGQEQEPYLPNSSVILNTIIDYSCLNGFATKTGGLARAICYRGNWKPAISIVGGCIPIAQDKFKCPDDYGFYPHNISCDKYWKCDNNNAEQKMCGNGLAFNASDPNYLTENCDYIYNIDCGDRSQLEPPISTPHCERLYGIFPDKDKCDVFWNCWNGEASRYQCSPGLAYDRETRLCIFADQVPECKNYEIAGGFSCPASGKVNISSPLSRHAHPDDCRKYYICLEGVAREYGCPIGTVFKIGDPEGSGNCEDPKIVPGCEDYYGDLDLKNIRKS